MPRLVLSLDGVVLREVGLSDAQIAALRERGVVA